jgi:hypothetical protein
VSLFLLKETNIHTIIVLIYHGMRNVTRAAGAMPRRQTHMRVRDARVSVLYILAHTVHMQTRSLHIHNKGKRELLLLHFLLQRLFLKIGLAIILHSIPLT